MALRSILVGVLGSLMLSESAMALSCRPADLAQTMNEAKASDKLYHVFVGRFSFNYRPIRPSFEERNRMGPIPPQITKARFNGFSLSPKRRYDVKLRDFPVDIEVSCAGPWCGAPPPKNERQIAFVEARRGLPPILRISACPGNTFPVSPKDGQVKSLRQCFDKTCLSQERPIYEHYKSR